MNKYIQIGYVTKPHGIKGALLVQSFAESMQLLEGELFIGSAPSSLRAVQVSSIKETGKGLLVTLVSITTRTQAEALQGGKLYIARERLPVLPEGDFYRIALLGFSVYADGEYIGVLESIQDVPLQELWHIRSPQQELLLFPAVPDYIDTVNEEMSAIYILPPEGLFDLYRK